MEFVVYAFAFLENTMDVNVIKAACQENQEVEDVVKVEDIIKTSIKFDLTNIIFILNNEKKKKKLKKFFKKYQSKKNYFNDKNYFIFSFL